MSFDEIISSLGEFGRYQRCIFSLLWLSAIIHGIHAFSIVFILREPAFRCALPTENGTDADSINYELPAEILQSSFEKGKPCEFHNEANASVTCSSYIYDKSDILNSAVTEWHLVCDHKWLISLQKSLFMVGFMIGSIVFGQLSDKLGRKPIIMVALGIQLISAFVAGFVRNFIIFSIARMLVGATAHGAFIMSYVLMTEMVGPHSRLYVSVSIMICSPIGALAATGYSYYLRDWRTLQIAMALTGLVFLPYPWLIPESTRWLLINKRKDAALANIRRIVNINKPNTTFEAIEEQINKLEKQSDTVTKEAAPTSKPTVFDLFRYPNLRRKTLLIFFDWFVVAGTFYGISFNTHVLGGNFFLSFAIIAATDIPAHFSMLLVLNRLGRRLVLCGALIFSGVGLLLTMIPVNNMNWLLITFAVLGKFGITAAFGAIYVFSVEQFPTVVRNVGMGAASMIARIGGILAPFLFMAAHIWRPLPLVTCGVLAFLGGSLTLLLPETLNKPTLETIADAENFTKKTESS